jgi:hypothetical protein
MTVILAVVSSLAALSSFRAWAQSAAGEELPTKEVNKSGYTIFNPTPPSLLRDMEALYESPYTVDAGHVQIETYPFGYWYHRDDLDGHQIDTEGWRFAPLNLRLGLLNNLDVQLGFAPYTTFRMRDQLSSTTEKHQGFGDIVPRVRINLWGNDSGNTAAAITPFLKIPTNQDQLGNQAYEGGVIFSWATKLPLSWWFIVTPEIDIVANVISSGYHTEGAGTAYFWHSLIGQLSGYVEFASRVSTEADVPWLGTVDLGVTYMLTKNIQLDTGVRVGVTKSADNLNPFIGISVRF